MKKVASGILFLAAIVLAVVLSGNIYAKKKTVFVNAWSNSSTIAGFYNEGRDSIDVLAVGSSTASNGIQPAVLWKEQGITAYNLSTEQQHPVAAYYLLMEALGYQKPSVVLINARWVVTDYEPDGENAGQAGNALDAQNSFLHYSLDFMRLSRAKVLAAFDIAAQSDKQSAMDYLLPFFRYHARQDLKRDDFCLDFLSTPHLLKGSSVQLSSVPLTFRAGRMDRKETADEGAINDFSGMGPQYVQKMIGLCREKGVHALLLALPIRDWDGEKSMTVAEFAEMYGAGFLDMNSDDIMEAASLDTASDFQSLSHVNIAGAAKTSSYLAGFLARNYTFGRDRSAVTASFDACADMFDSYAAAYRDMTTLPAITNLEEYCAALGATDGNIVVFTVRDDMAAGLAPGQAAALRELGMETDFLAGAYQRSYIAVLDGRRVVYEECSPKLLEYVYAPGGGAEFAVTSAGSKAEILVSGVSRAINKRGINIVVYNRAVKSVIDTVCFDTHGAGGALRK